MNLLQTLAKISSMTMISRILGFIRDAVIARVFGAGVATDAFFVAFKLPNLLRRIFAEGAFSQAFVPILAEYKTSKGETETVLFSRYVAGLLSFVLFWVTILGIVIAPWIIWISAPGFSADADKFQLAISLLRITFPYIFFISLSSFVGSLLNAYNRFTVPAFTPTFLNISFIIFAAFLTPYFREPVYALAWAVFVGGILQLAFQLPFLYRLGFLKMPKLSFHNAGVNRVLKQMIPAILGVSVAQISLVINTIFASFLPTGSVSWMYYADRLMELPTGVLGVALGTMLLPTLSKHASGDNPQAFSELLGWGIRLSLLLALPCAAALSIIAFPVVATLFMYREFTVFDAQMTQMALSAYAFGLVGLILIKVLAPGFYARQNIKTPVKIAIITLIITQLLNLSLIWHFKHAGLALAISIGACFNAGLLYYLLRRQGIYRPDAQQKIFIIRILIATAVMTVILWLVQHQSIYPFNWTGSGSLRVLQLLLLFVIGVVIYFATLFLLGFRVQHIKRHEV
ncbi:MAG: murein biosynthesis integral membrane protein MurJ [Neisseriaceae bacterium]|nr:murein biosynthesis integral membrane protein MurJ [Neisseriaceae bacterium]